MLQSIQINHFRCFTDLHVDGLSRFNLIGGGNNSGKTALLEALLINHLPNSDALNYIQGIRLENQSMKTALTDKICDYLFLNLDASKNIEITSKSIDNSWKILLKKENIKERDIFIDVIGEQSTQLQTHYKNYLHKNKDASILSIFYGKEKGDMMPASSLFITDFGQMGENKPKALDAIPLLFISSSKHNIDPQELAEKFSEILVAGKYLTVLNAVKIIDSSVQSIHVKTINNFSILTASRDNEVFLPIGLFGDAFAMMIELTIQIFILANSEKSCILLIDEIENGIHHNNHYKFLEYIYKLSKEYNIQIFATTHSIEMIEAFSQLALDQNELKTDFNYIEMAKNRKNKIIAISIEPEIIQYKIENDRPFRGEHR